MDDDGANFFSPWRCLSVSRKENTSAFENETPLYSVGWQQTLGPTSQLANPEEYKVALSSKGITAIRNEPASHVRIASREWGFADWFFGPNRGYLPLFVSMNNVSPDRVVYPENQIHVLESKFLEKQGWFPTHIVKLFPDQNSKNLVRVVDIKVTDLSDKVSEDDFLISVPAGTLVQWSDSTKSGSSDFKTRKNEKISPRDIPKIIKMLDRNSANSNIESSPAAPPAEPLMDTAIHVEGSGRSKWYVAAASILVVLVAIALFRWYRVRST